MPGFPLLDIAIGLVFVYLLLSLVCSSLNEGLESILRNRANDLEAGIRNLLGDKRASWWASFLPWVNSIKNTSITREFYLHPLIRVLFQTEKRLPTYIPARNFALAVLDLVGKNGALVQGATNHPNNLDPNALPLLDSVNQIALPAQLKKSVTALIVAADGNTQQARINIENWFNSSMDRVSGWYKSRTQMILFAIGVVVTIVVNADSIMIYRNLSQSKNLQAVIDAAEKARSEYSPSGQNNQVQIGNVINQLNGLGISVGWVSEVDQKANAINENHPLRLDRGKLPPSWNKNSCQSETWPCQDPIGWSFHLLFLHGVGWLITAAATTLGAPFWFDMLNRFMVVRSTIKPNEKSQEEGSKDRRGTP